MITNEYFEISLLILSQKNILEKKEKLSKYKFYNPILKLKFY